MTKFLWLPLITLLGACAITPQTHTARHEVVTKAVVEQEVSSMFKGSWTDREKVAWSASALAHIADLAVTVSALDSPTCTESNPILGSHPSTGSIVALKAAIISAEYWLQAQDYKDTWIYSAVSAVDVGAVAARNTQVDCYDQR